MAVIKIYLFGTPRVEREGKEIILNRRKMQALLAYLAVTGQPHSRETLSTLLWPENDNSSALANLRRDLSRLKEAVGDDILDVGHNHVRLNPNARVWLDVNEYNRLVDKAENHNHSNNEGDLCVVCAKALEEAAILYTADFMAGFNLPDCPQFDEWQFFQAEKLRQSLAKVLRQIVQRNLNQNEPQKAVEPARRWLSLDQFHEPAHRMLMQIYALVGQPAAAMRQFQSLTRILVEEMGIEPEPETRLLYEAIRTRKFPIDANGIRWSGKSSEEEERTAPLQKEQVEKGRDVLQRSAEETLLSGSGRQVERMFAEAGSLAAEERYQRKELIVKGGFGEIYIGQDRFTGQPVAIKSLKPELVAERPDLVSRFLQECEVLRQLSHPNIVRMLDAFQKDSQYFLVMEYLPGGTLRDLIEQQKQLPIEQVLDLSLELADALARAHHLHILHRDLKPENVLLTADGRPRLIDFGLARLERFDARLTQAGLIFGSPAYMSPEALRGMELDVRADIWSFGVLLYEMIAGQTPFQGDQIMTVLSQILNDPLPQIESFRSEAPPDIVDLINRMLVKDRGNRLSSMRQAAAILETIREKITRESGPVPTQASRDGAATPDAVADHTANREADPVQYGRNLERKLIYSQSTPFIGRERELGEIQQLLEGKDCRLLTLVGTGGVGKTRLAMETAARMASTFRNGTALVLLAPVSEADQLTLAILEALDIIIRVGVDPKSQLLNYLQDRSMLLVLDNFEQLIGSVGLLSDILASAPDVRLLVTSRERLNLSSEFVYELDGLPYPDHLSKIAFDEQRLTDAFPAVQLFIQLARKVNPEFTLGPTDLASVVKICQLVEGMPLAIELAAPWVRTMTCEEIAQEIERNIDLLSTSLLDVPERHRSVRVVFMQSWQRLSQSEQTLLENLSVFYGSCECQDVLKVTGTNQELLAGLVDRAFLRRRDDRFEMHELVRQFAHERLTADPDRHNEMVTRHSRYFLSMLAERTGEMKGGRQKEAIGEIITEIDNIRAAWRRAVNRTDLDALAEAAEAFWLFNEFRGTLHEGEIAFQQAVERLLYVPYQAGLAGFMIAAQGCMAARHGQLERGRRLMNQGIELQTRSTHPDRQMLGFSRAWLGFVLILQGRYEEARRLMEENLALYPQVNDPWSQAGSLRIMGASLLFSGRIAEAGKYLLECLKICEEINERRIRIYALMNLGIIETWLGDYELARQRFDEAVQISAASNDPLRKADVIRERTRLLFATGAYGEALENMKTCLSIYRAIGRSDLSAAMVFLGWAYFYHDQYEQAEQAFREGLTAARLAGNRSDEAVSLEGLARIAVWQRDWVKAFDCLHEALDIWKEIGHEPQMALLQVLIGTSELLSGRIGAVERSALAFQQALQISVNHSLAPMAMRALVALAQWIIGQEGRWEIDQAGLLLELVIHHAASPYSARQKAKELFSEIGHTVSGKTQPEDWIKYAESWIKRLNKEQPVGV